MAKNPCKIHSLEIVTPHRFETQHFFDISKLLRISSTHNDYTSVSSSLLIRSVTRDCAGLDFSIFRNPTIDFGRSYCFSSFIISFAALITFCDAMYNLKAEKCRKLRLFDVVGCVKHYKWLWMLNNIVYHQKCLIRFSFSPL